MTKNEIIVSMYGSDIILRYCRTIHPEYDELKSQLIIQLIQMPDHKLITAEEKGFVISVLHLYTRVKPDDKKASVITQSIFKKYLGNKNYQKLNEDELSLVVYCMEHTVNYGSTNEYKTEANTILKKLL